MIWMGTAAGVETELHCAVGHVLAAVMMALE